MSQWSVNPDNDVNINQSTGEITFPKNTGKTSVTYTISYTGDNSCTAETTYTVGTCECQVSLSVSDFKCDDEDYQPYITVSLDSSKDVFDKPNVEWTLGSYSDRFLLSDLNDGNEVNLYFDDLQTGDYTFEWSVGDCGSGSKSLKYDGSCVDTDYYIGSFTLSMTGMCSASEDRCSSPLPWTLHSAEIRYKLVAKLSNGTYVDVISKNGSQIYKEFMAEDGSSLHAIDSLCPENGGSNHQISSVEIDTDLNGVVDSIDFNRDYNGETITIDNVYLSILYTGSNVHGRNDLYNGTELKGCCDRLGEINITQLDRYFDIITEGNYVWYRTKDNISGLKNYYIDMNVRIEC